MHRRWWRVHTYSLTCGTPPPRSLLTTRQRTHCYQRMIAGLGQCSQTLKNHEMHYIEFAKSYLAAFYQYVYHVNFATLLVLLLPVNVAVDGVGGVIVAWPRVCCPLL